jgi:simple sugar transport system permease protein
MNSKQINLLVDISKMVMIIATSCILVSIIVFLVSDVPETAIKSFFFGSFSSVRRIGNIIEASIPLIFTGLAVNIIFRSGQFSMISEGAFFVGACGAMIAGISLKLPPVIHPVVTISLGALLGAIAAGIPAILKLFWKTSELVTSIMLNYICLYVSLYIMNYHYRDTATTAFQSYKVQNTATLVGIISGTRIHIGVIVALVLCIVLWLLLFRFRLGYKIRVTGDNALFAKYAGIGAASVMFMAQIIAGAVAGMGGAVELLGMYSRFRWVDMPGYGWTGIVVALLARLNPLLIPLSACFIAYLNVGADIMSRSSDVSSEVVLIIQSVMMLLIAADALLDNWRQRMIVKVAEQETSLEAGK